MKKIFQYCISSLVSTTLLLTGCATTTNINQNTSDSQVGINNVNLANDNSSIFKEKNIRVNIDRASIYGSKVQISSSFSQFTAKTSELVKTPQNILINQLSPQLITLARDDSADKTPQARSIVSTPMRARSILISPQTTAEALIFMTPGLATDNTLLAEKVMNIIKNLSETKELAKIIEIRTQKEDDFLSKENQEQNLVINRAVNSAINRLADEFDRNKIRESNNIVDGIEIKTNSQNQSSINLQMKNYKKRMVSLYFNADVQGKDSLFNENLDSSNDFIDFNNISLGMKPLLKEGNYNLSKPLNNVEVIGLGLKDIKEFSNKWSGYDNQEKIKYGLPIGKSLMFDFVSPVISIIMGFNVNKVYQVGFLKILTSLPILQIIEEFKNKEYGKAFKTILGGTFRALLANNAALLRELLAKSGVSFTESILKRFTAVSGIFNLVRYSVEAARTFYAYSTTNISSFFTVQNNNGKYEFLKKE